VTVQCKAQWYYKSPSRQLKNEGEKVEIGATHLYTLLYDSKIPHAGTA